jgi:outer membrane protein assembly factor BamB
VRRRRSAGVLALAGVAALLAAVAPPARAATVRTSWHSPSLDGTVQGAPVVVGDVVVVATEHDALYGLSLRDGHRLWGPRRVGQPVPLSVVASKSPSADGCGDIDPLGITSSLVVDPTTPPRVFAVAEVLGPGDAVAHDLVGVDPVTGKVLVGPTPIDPPAMTHPELEQQRAGLTFANGRVYVGFGGLYGDCGDYHGFVVAANPDGSGIAGTFEAADAGGGDRAAAVWATDSPPVDAAGHLYIATGNSEDAPGPPTFDYGDSVVALDPSLNVVSAFQPSTYEADNASDLDLGSTAPVPVGDGQLFELGKQEKAFLLNGANLGGTDHHTPLASIDSCGAFGANATLGTSVFVACRNSLQQILINRATNPPTLAHGWSAAVPAGGPITVASGLLWSVDVAGGTLYALNPVNGRVVAHHPISLDSSQHFPTPTVAGGWVVVETANGLAAFTLPGSRASAKA